MKIYLLRLSILFSLFIFFSDHLSAQCCDKVETKNCCSKNTCDSIHQHGMSPIGIMSDHTHSKGGLMLSYRYMNMFMNGNLSKTNEVSNEIIFDDYMMAPQDMRMQMHMMGLMYGVSDQITLMGMLNYQEMDMDMIMMDGRAHTHRSSGIGDFKIKAITKLWQSKYQFVHLDFGISLPTADIAKKEVNHFAHIGGEHEDVVMPYPMRLGSGTYDVLIGATYTVNWNKVALSFQTGSTLRTQNNKRGYRLGNQWKMNTWIGYKTNDWLGFSLRAEYLSIQKINGIDEGLLLTLSPPNNAINSGGDRMFTHLGFNISLPNILNGFEIGTEFGIPLYQRVEGIQMDYSNLMTIGVKGNIL